MLTIMAGMSSILVLIGCAAYYLILVFGGARELQSANDAGSLNVAKQFLKTPGVNLQGNQENALFGDLLDQETGQINLGNYNAVVGRALQIGINAQVLGTPAARANAKRALVLAQTGPNSIGKRLTAKLQNGNSASGAFEAAAFPNSLRMFGSKPAGTYKPDRYQFSYMNAGDASNLVVPTKLATRIPRQSRNLVTSAGKANHLVTESFAVVGVGNRTHDMLMPAAFIRIVNKAGFPGPVSITRTKAIFNQQLIAGIYLGQANGANTVFTTDPDALDQLIAFSNGKSTTQPPSLDKNRNAVFFDTSGQALKFDPAATTQPLNKVTGRGPVVTDSIAGFIGASDEAQSVDDRPDGGTD